MIKVANNLSELCQTRSKQSFTVPTEEQQLLAAVTPIVRNRNNSYMRSNTAQGALLGAGAGALAGLPFGGVGAIPGAIGGGVLGAIGGGVIPELMATRSKTTITPDELALIEAINSSKHRRANRIARTGALLGAGAGALAGLPFGGVGAIPGALVGLIGGSAIGKGIGRNTADPDILALTKDNPTYKKLVAKLEESQTEKE
jgi:hypothetical protein